MFAGVLHDGHGSGAKSIAMAGLESYNLCCHRFKRNPRHSV